MNGTARLVVDPYSGFRAELVDQWENVMWSSPFFDTIEGALVAVAQYVGRPLAVEIVPAT